MKKIASVLLSILCICTTSIYALDNAEEKKENVKKIDNMIRESGIVRSIEGIITAESFVVKLYSREQEPLYAVAINNSLIDANQLTQMKKKLTSLSGVTKLQEQKMPSKKKQQSSLFFVYLDKNIIPDMGAFVFSGPHDKLGTSMLMALAIKKSKN